MLGRVECKWGEFSLREGSGIPCGSRGSWLLGGWLVGPVSVVGHLSNGLLSKSR